MLLDVFFNALNRLKHMLYVVVQSKFIQRGHTGIALLST
jgi:hypothetical protein